MCVTGKKRFQSIFLNELCCFSKRGACVFPSRRFLPAPLRGLSVCTAHWFAVAVLLFPGVRTRARISFTSLRTVETTAGIMSPGVTGHRRPGRSVLGQGKKRAWCLRQRKKSCLFCISSSEHFQVVLLISVPFLCRFLKRTN